MTDNIKKYIRAAIVETFERVLSEEHGDAPLSVKQTTADFHREMENRDGIHMHTVGGQHVYNVDTDDRGETLGYYIHDEPSQRTSSVEFYIEDGKKSLSDIKKHLEKSTDIKLHPKIIYHIHKDHNYNVFD